jgi:hypothetical protein
MKTRAITNTDAKKFQMEVDSILNQFSDFSKFKVFYSTELANGHIFYCALIIWN